MTDITPEKIISDAPLGALIRFSDRTTQPPARFKRKLSAWENANGVGTLAEVNPDHGTFTLHMGDLGGGGVIVMRVYRTYDRSSSLAFTLERQAVEGSILCATVYGGRWKIDKITDDAGGAAWLRNNTFGELLRVGASGALSVAHASARAA